jgi:hypothetical protein
VLSGIQIGKLSGVETPMSLENGEDFNGVISDTIDDPVGSQKHFTDVGPMYLWHDSTCFRRFRGPPRPFPKTLHPTPSSGRVIPNDVSANSQEIAPGARCPKKSHD